MLPGVTLAVLLLLAHATGQPCRCSALPSVHLRVNCSSLDLMELSHLPSDTTELHAQDNRLTSVSPGLFDKLVGLEKVSLSGNPFHCDCSIQYLRNWLLKNRAIVSKQPICASPSSVAQKAIVELSDDYFSSCVPAGCAERIFNTVMAVMLCCLIVLLLWTLRLAKASTITLNIDEKHSGFEAISLSSLKPKHRRKRLQTMRSEVSMESDSLTWTEDLEKPLLNMELLPQVLDVLHKKHNIKINPPERPLSLRPWNYKNSTSNKLS